MGFFDADINGDDTMSPLQREFIRLAQIFKSRLIVELEYNQRIHERGMIEERLGDQNAELMAAKAKEDKAKKQLDDAQQGLTLARKQVMLAVVKLRAQLAEVNNQPSKP